MVHFIYLDRLELNIFVDVIVLGSTEFLTALLSKVFLKNLKRRTAFVLVCSFIMACFFFLLIFGPNNIQTRYVVTICTRGVLQIMYIVLTVITLEQFPTETRASSTAISMSVGLLGGVGLAFVDGLSNSLLIGLLLLFATAATGTFFIRETTNEPALMNHYSDILREAENVALDKLMRNDQLEESNPQKVGQAVFDRILEELEGVGKEDKSKIGTMMGSPRGIQQMIAIDLNSDLFEHIPPLEDHSSSSSSQEEEEQKELSSDSGIDDSDYDEMEFNEDSSRSYPRFVELKSNRYPIEDTDRDQTFRSEPSEAEEPSHRSSSFWEARADTSIRGISKEESKIEIEMNGESFVYEEEDMLTENDVDGALQMQFDKYN